MGSEMCIRDRWYIASGEHRGKAGSYGIQGKAALFVDRIEGSYQSVVGLPLALVDSLASSVGHPLREFAADQEVSAASRVVG